MKPSKSIVVAGAGIVGASIAYYLTKAGAQVIIIDKGAPAQGTTANSFAWINASRGKSPFHYYLFNRLGIGAWHQLEQELDGALKINWGGSVEWGKDSSDTKALLTATRQHQQLGYPLQIINKKQLAKLEPFVVTDDALETAVYTSIEGHINPVAATGVLLDKAQALGATLITECLVTDIQQSNKKLQKIQTSKGTLDAQKLVIACGNGTPQIASLAGIDVPLKDSPGVLAHSNPLPPLINRVLLTPYGHLKQNPDGAILVGSSFSGTDGTDDSFEAGRTLFEQAAKSVPQLKDASIKKMTLGWRVLPNDELPIIGSPLVAPDIYIAAMHSGITLSPLVGQLAAMELVDNVDVEMLRPYRLERFTNNAGK